MTQQADMIRAQARTVADSESRALLRTARGFGVQQKVQQRPLTVGTQHDRQHTDLAGTAAKGPEPPLLRDEEAAGSNPATPTQLTGHSPAAGRGLSHAGHLSAFRYSGFTG